MQKSSIRKLPNRLTDMQPWFTVYFFDIGYQCYDQLTPVKIRYLLTSIKPPYPGLKFITYRSVSLKLPR